MSNTRHTKPQAQAERGATTNGNMNGAGAGASKNNRSDLGDGVVPVRQPLGQPTDFQQENFGRFRDSAGSDSSSVPPLTRLHGQQPSQPYISGYQTVNHESDWSDTDWSDTSATDPDSLQSAQLSTPPKSNVYINPPPRQSPQDHALTPRFAVPVDHPANDTNNTDPTSLQSTQLNTPSKSNVYVAPPLRRNPQDHALTPRISSPLIPNPLYQPANNISTASGNTTSQGAQQGILRGPGEVSSFASQYSIGARQPPILSYAEAAAAALPAPSQPTSEVHLPGEPLVLPQLRTMLSSEKAFRINEAQPGRDDPAFKLIKNANGFRDAYRGDPLNVNNIPYNVPNEANCNLHITGLPAACTYAQLEGALGDSYGSIFAMDLKPPEGDWTTSAADIAFMHREPAERLFRDMKPGGWLVQGHRAVVGWNRNKVAASPESDLKNRPISRCLRISGPGEVVNETSLAGMFQKHFWWRTSAIDIVHRDPATGYTVMEWRFCRVSGQTDMAARCVMKLKKENPGRYSKVQWRLAKDPCGLNAPRNPTAPNLASFLAHKENGLQRRPSAVDGEISRRRDRDLLEQGSGTKPHRRSGRRRGGHSSSSARAGRESWR